MCFASCLLPKLIAMLVEVFNGVIRLVAPSDIERPASEWTGEGYNDD